MREGRFALAVLLLPGLVGGARAGESYYLAVFGSQRPSGLPSHTHSFATFVRVAGLDAGGGACQVQCWTISWMPQTLEIDIYRLFPECGVNLDLHSTLRWALGDRQRVSLWGPYQIRKELFEQALGQVAHLQSGAVRYKAVDMGYPTECVSNCIHALGDVVLGGSQLRIGTPGWGESASYFVTLAYAPWIIQPCQTHDWIAVRLGLGRYPLIRRDLECNPSRNPLLRALQAVRYQSLNRNRGD